MNRTKLTWNEVCNIMRKHNNLTGIKSKGGDTAPLYAVVVFTEDTFNEPYTETQRSYCFSSSNKAFLPNMNSNSIFGDCLDGTDNGIRLAQYIYIGWKVDYCYLRYDSLNVIDIKTLDKQYLTEDDIEELEENENVCTVECLGYSGHDIHALWYDVTFGDGLHIDIYSKIPAEE